MAGPLIAVGVVVLRDRAADDDPRAARELREHRVEDVAADVVEIDVDALGAMLAQRLLDVLALVVDGGVEAELVDEVAGTSPAPPAMPTTRQPLILAICPTTVPTAPAAPETTTVSPGLRLADLEQAEIGGHAGHAERAQIDRQRRGSRVDLGQALAVGQRIFLHAQACRTRDRRPRSRDACDAITRPTAPARITSPMPTGGI